MKHYTRKGPGSQGLSAGHEQTTAAQGFAALFTNPQEPTALQQSAEELFLASLESQSYSPALQLLVDAIGALREVAATVEPDTAPVALALAALTVAYERREVPGRPSALGSFSSKEPSTEGSKTKTRNCSGPSRPESSAPSLLAQAPPSASLRANRSEDVVFFHAREAPVPAHRAEGNGSGNGPTPQFFTPSFERRGAGPVQGRAAFRLKPPPGPQDDAPKGSREPLPFTAPGIPPEAFPALAAYGFGADTISKRRLLTREQSSRVADNLRRLADAGADLSRVGEVTSWLKSWAKFNPSPEKVREYWWRAIAAIDAKQPSVVVAQILDGEYDRTVENMQRAALAELGAKGPGAKGGVL